MILVSELARSGNDNRDLWNYAKGIIGYGYDFTAGTTNPFDINLRHVGDANTSFLAVGLVFDWNSADSNHLPYMTSQNFEVSPGLPAEDLP